MHSNPDCLLPAKTYHLVRNLYRQYRPGNRLSYATYLLSVQAGFGCFGPRGASAAIGMVQELLKELKGASITLVPVMCAASEPAASCMEPEKGQHMLNTIVSRFIRQLALDLLYKDKETYRVNTALEKEILRIWQSVQDDPPQNLSNIFPVTQTSTGDSFIPHVTHGEYIFTVALGTCLAASGKNKVRTKLIHALSQTVFGIPPGSLKRISGRVFEMIDEDPVPASLTHCLAAHFLLEFLTEGFWLAATSPYAACVHYLTDRVWMDVGTEKTENQEDTPDDARRQNLPGPGPETEQYNLTSERIMAGMGEADNGVLESLGVTFVMDQEDLFLQQAGTDLLRLIGQAGEPAEESDGEQVWCKAALLLASEVHRLNCRLDAFSHRMPDVATKSSRKENKKLMLENEMLQSTVDSLQKELADCRASHQADCEKHFARGQKQTQSILYPELASLRKELKAQEEKNASLVADQRELIQLRELIFNDQADCAEPAGPEQDVLTEAEEQEIRTFLENNKVVFIGGHIRQNRDFAKKYGNITLAESPTFPPEAAANARLIIVFANWVSHTTYYKAAGIARRRGIPVEYINARNMGYSERELLNIIRKHA